MLSLTTEGDRDLAAKLNGAGAAIRVALRTKAERLAQMLVAHIVQDKLSGQVLQTRSGALRAAIEAEVTEDGVRLYARGDLKYAAIQEYGGHTPAHDIAPNRAKALAFLVGGRMRFGRIVHHPGSNIPARPFMGPALAEMGPQIASEFKTAVVAALIG